MKRKITPKDLWRIHNVVLENTEDKVDAIKQKLGVGTTDVDTLDIDPSVGSFDLGESTDSIIDEIDSDVDGFDFTEFDMDEPVVDESTGFDL
jgi:hypothetical protein